MDLRLQAKIVLSSPVFYLRENQYLIECNIQISFVKKFLIFIDFFYRLTYKNLTILDPFFFLQTMSFRVTLSNMSRKPLRLFVSLLVLSTFCMGMFTFAGSVTAFTPMSQPSCGKTSGPGFKKPCDMDHCKPNLPKCPLCSSPGSAVPYLGQGALNYLPPLNCSFVLVCFDTLSDQGFIRSIFRPPTSIL